MEAACQPKKDKAQLKKYFWQPFLVIDVVQYYLRKVESKSLILIKNQYRGLKLETQNA